MSFEKEELEFLKKYDKNAFERCSMTADILIVSISNEESDNYRKNEKKRMSILLVKRTDFPYKGKWCLPGGFLDVTKETLEECAKRVLKAETNLQDIFLEQLYTFDGVNRDPRMRVISTSFVALVDKALLKEKVENASWFDVMEWKDTKNRFELLLQNNNETILLDFDKKLKNPTSSNYDYISKKENDLAFDHDIVIAQGLTRLRGKVSYTDIVFNMMPKYFTLKELQQVYEIILNKKLLDPAFRRIIANKVVKTKKMKTGEGHRPSYLFQYRGNE